MDALPYALLLRRIANPLLDRTRCQWLTAWVAEHGPMAFCDFASVRLQGGDSGATDGNDAGFSAFAQHTDQAVLQIDIGPSQGNQLRQTKAG